mmetsp:Transcript_472/g.1753  ORF Transcript_472/g.1753 Transcript_472/m.1753 type:complete len:239 (-) Transcript_472:1451-2167(-)
MLLRRGRQLRRPVRPGEIIEEEMPQPLLRRNVLEPVLQNVARRLRVDRILGDVGDEEVELRDPRVMLEADVREHEAALVERNEGLQRPGDDREVDAPGLREGAEQADIRVAVGWRGAGAVEADDPDVLLVGAVVELVVRERDALAAAADGLPGLARHLVKVDVAPAAGLEARDDDGLAELHPSRVACCHGAVATEVDVANGSLVAAGRRPHLHEAAVAVAQRHVPSDGRAGGQGAHGA